ncbi:hypothetical protein AJ80_07456 [Polytolypa hystricis UAMH7299]|uniref:Altered inheritance of mitochondria protein 9, mitochondrial n=1 Tax=Polytolypa hystricis (strain UAMH7299) TaxID=1447883 RepID=A0A2B7XNT8_POLH7|nr:hypothetical protein AJ80_07456 [Polytolypa hystricis UAMH7299]
MRGFSAFGIKFWSPSKKSTPSQPCETVSITCQGKPINREELFKYTNGRFLVNETTACDRRYVKFDVDQLCAIAASVGSRHSPVRTIEKMEGGFSKALLLQREDGSEVIAKIPFSIAGPRKYTTASEVAILQYVHAHTQVPVPKVLAWSSDSSNPIGAEYILMEKAPGVQLFKRWGDMSDYDQLLLVKGLAKMERELTNIPFPANGSLYLRESMASNDKYELLNPDMDPTGQFCIGPPCEQGWISQNEMASSQSHLNLGPWPNLSVFGIALAEREISRINQNTTTVTLGPPRGSVNEQLALLTIAKSIMSKLDSQTLVDKVSQPNLWHTDLHMGNIYVSDENPPTIVSLIDWQSIKISPLFLQARFPEFLSFDEDYYTLGSEVSQLPKDIDQMDADVKDIVEYKLREAKLAKAYELSTESKNNQAYKALFIPSFLRELFFRCGEVLEHGVIPLRASLIGIADAWNELGFTGDCPFTFSEEEKQKHDQEFQKYHDFQRIQEVARKGLSTDSEGWVAPQLDFTMKQRQNEELLEHIMRRSAEYNMSPEEVRSIWPFLQRWRMGKHKPVSSSLKPSNMYGWVQRDNLYAAYSRLICCFLKSYALSPRRQPLAAELCAQPVQIQGCEWLQRFLSMHAGWSLVWGAAGKQEQEIKAPQARQDEKRERRARVQLEI